MKRILYIARNELYSLYYSPVAWLLMALFVFLSSRSYLEMMGYFMGAYERGGPSLAGVHDVTSVITVSSGMSYFKAALGSLYMYFPLITMGLMSRETSSGTIRLLYSSPLRIREIVLGKFMAMIIFALTLQLLLCLPLFGLSSALYHPDFIQLFFSLIGVFLVLCTYAAIGLFFSSLTSYQIVAAIVTVVFFGFLDNAGRMFKGSDVLQQIMYYMKFTGKSKRLVEGLVNLRDICYFLVLITGFLSFTIIRIKSGTESVSKLKKFSRYMAVVAIAFVIGYITSRPAVNAYYDATRSKLYTITPPTQAMLAKLNDGPLELTIYCNLLDWHFDSFLPSEKNAFISFLWEPYIRFKPDIHINWVYYYGIDSTSYYYKINPGKTLKEIAEKHAKSYRLTIRHFLTPEEVSKQVDVQKEKYGCFYELAYKGKKVILRNFTVADDNYFPFEDEIAASLNRLIAVPPKVLFLDGEIERGPFSERVRDYMTISSDIGYRRALVNQGYDFDTLSLAGGGTIPQDIAALVIADPRTPLSPVKVAKINDYIAAGGNLFLVSEPDRREILQPVLDKIGLSLRSGVMIQSSDKFSSDWLFSNLTDTAINITPQFRRTIDDVHKYYGDDKFRVIMGGASAMEYKEQDGWHIDPLLYSDAALSWNRVAPMNPDSLNLKVRRLPGDEKGPFVTAVRMHRRINGKEQRIIAASDGDYLTGPLLWNNGEYRHYNYDYGFWAFSYFSYGQFPANTLKPESLDNKFKIKVKQLPFQRAVFIYIIPALIVILGTIILVRRKRK